MASNFAPNNNEASRILYTGMTPTLDRIFNLILAGNCVGLYGERRSGKTLTLELIQLIINGNIEKYEQRMVDQTLLKAIPLWKSKLAGRKAIYVSLQGTRRESELLRKFIDQIEDTGIQLSSNILFDPNSMPPGARPETMIDLFERLQDRFSSTAQCLVVLVDEMEILEDYENGEGVPVAELFCDRTNYKNLIFVHAGSYLWREENSSKGSLYTHLEHEYVKNIKESELTDFLLKPLASDEMKTFVTVMSGGKPLYAQYMGKALEERGSLLTEEDLMQIDALRMQTENNIYKEPRLDGESKLILAALAHHKGVTEEWLAKKLRLNQTEVTYKLTRMVSFGTISESKGRYRIIGRFVESYGRKICDDPASKRYGRPPSLWSEKLGPIARWMTPVMMIALIMTIYVYTHPLSELKHYSFPTGVLKLEVPPSLETGEEGILRASVSNTGPAAIASLILVFDSEQIRYNKDGMNALSFSNIEPSRTAYADIAYYVSPGDGKILESHVSMSSVPPFSFEAKRRPVSVKRYSTPFYIILSLIGLIAPWKQWASFANVLRRALPSQDSGMRKSGKSGVDTD